jgi:hypothetical protein
MQGANLTSARVEVVLDQMARRLPPAGVTIPAKYRLIVLMRLVMANVHSDYSQLPELP